MLIPANDKVVITRAITIRSKMLIFMVLLLVTRARSMLYARTCGAKKAVDSDHFSRADRGTRMKVPSLTSNRSTKRSNLIRERPFTSSFYLQGHPLAMSNMPRVRTNFRDRTHRLDRQPYTD